MVYNSIQTGESLTPEEVQLSGTKLKSFYARRGDFRIRTDGVMEIRLVVNEKVRWCVACPSTIRQTVFWETHGLVHAKMNKTVA